MKLVTPRHIFPWTIVDNNLPTPCDVLRTLDAISFAKSKHWNTGVTILYFASLLNFLYTIIDLWSNLCVLWEFPSINCQWSTKRSTVIILYNSLRRGIFPWKICRRQSCNAARCSWNTGCDKVETQALGGWERSEATTRWARVHEVRSQQFGALCSMSQVLGPTLRSFVAVVC